MSDCWTDSGPRSALNGSPLHRIDRAAYEGSRVERQADIVTYLAMLRLEGLRPPPFMYCQRVSRLT
jgi:hypothetical protein